MNDDGWLVLSGRRNKAGHGSVKPNEAAIPEGSEAEGVPATGLWILKALCHSIVFNFQRETGLGWNHEKGTIDATPQRWAELKAQMFDKIVVTGETAWTLVAVPIPPVQQNVGFEDAVDLEEGSGDFDEVNVIPTQTGGSSEKRKKNTIGPSLTGKRKKVKVGGATYMQKQLNRLCDAVESYTTTTLSDSSKKNYETYPDTSEECMEMLLTLPGVEDGNELFMLARVGKGQDKVRDGEGEIRW
ncbi:hypothetical protein SLEP1_g1028 [Rubroshorea leprosula]|uniref:Myb/SANT-like domain-containing protein n=1 Tax=Rubroshorea leprosula TaxID=152421 RepID=A0AAV5HH68_9ROSI|nr:hypothetical protein SLEP1_g1028 [Rubroshorea leprosula]